jgi:hypothetical protein
LSLKSPQVAGVRFPEGEFKILFFSIFLLSSILIFYLEGKKKEKNYLNIFGQ